MRARQNGLNDLNQSIAVEQQPSEKSSRHLIVIDFSIYAERPKISNKLQCWINARLARTRMHIHTLAEIWSRYSVELSQSPPPRVEVRSNLLLPANVVCYHISMLVSSCSIAKVKCPTSLFPISPQGKPTASPPACNVKVG